MSLVDVDTWITEFDACERLSHTILSQITQRDREEKLSADYSKISANIRIRLKQFETELSQLRLKLNSTSVYGSITVEEIERRQRQIEILQSKQLFLQNKFRKTSRTDRDDLITSTRGSLWEGDDDDEPIISAEKASPHDLREQQIQIMENQNRGLEALAKSISRQKNLASRLGQEVEEQNEIIDDLADNMDRIDTRVNAETMNVGQINRADKTCGYWIIILILFLAIIIVVLL